MAVNFQQKPTAKIVAAVTGSSSKLTIDGTNAAESSADNAVEQINKITAIFGVEVNTTGIKQVIEKDGVTSV